MNITEYLNKRDEVSMKIPSRWFILSWWGILISSLYALFIVLFRVMGINSNIDIFQRSLVGHVDMGIFVSLLSFAGGLFSLTINGKFPRLERAAVLLSWTGGALIALSPLRTTGKPIMNDYIPVIMDELFFSGISLFWAGIISISLLTVISLFNKKDKTGFEWFIYGAALSILVAAVNIITAIILMPNRIYGRYFFQRIFWGGGHILMFCHTILMLLSWQILFNKAIHASKFKRFILIILFPVFISLFIPIFFNIGSHGYRSFFTYIMGMLGIIALIFILLIPKSGVEGKPVPDNNKNNISVFYYISIFLFIAGSVIGAFIRENNSLVPAHYHGVIGAVTAAYMGTIYQYTDMKKTFSKRIKIQGLLYGIGLIFMIIGLITANYIRKGIILTGYPLIGKILFGTGGVLSISGNLLFILITSSYMTINKVYDKRRYALGITIIAIFITVISINMIQAMTTKTENPSSKDYKTTVLSGKDKEEINIRFNQALSMMHLAKYEYAVTALNRVLQIAPRMPEAHINMGFALFELKEYDMAEDFFMSAIDIKPFQSNAYYGLAKSLAGKNDIEGALGAMKSYLHLTKGENRFKDNAKTLIAEWEGRVKEKQH